MPLQVDDLVGTPFDDEHFNCWSLVKEVFKRNGVNLPDYNISPNDPQSIHKQIDIERLSGDWFRRPSGQEKEGDLIVLNVDCGPYSNHLGVYLGQKKFIHIMRGVMVHISRIDHPLWRTRIEGFYRWKDSS